MSRFENIDLDGALADVSRAARDLQGLLDCADVSARARAKLERDRLAREREFNEQPCRVSRFDGATGRFVKGYGVHPRGLAEHVAKLAAEKHRGARVEVQPVPERINKR